MNPFALHTVNTCLPNFWVAFSRTCLLTVILISSVGFASPPNLDETISAWVTARTWLDSNSLPDANSSEATINVQGITGASVVLRLDGRRVGFASDFNDSPHLFRTLLGKALGEALGDPTIKNLPESIRKSAPQRLTLEIECAGPTEPLLGSTLASAVGRIRPGSDGIAVRRNEEWAYAFPGRSLASGTAGSVTSTIIRLCTELGLPPRDLPELRKLDQVDLHRFSTLRIAQTDPRGLPFEAHRSGPYVAEFTRGGPEHQGLITSLVSRLHNRIVEAKEDSEPTLTFLGDFDPISGSYSPVQASRLDQAKAARALAETAQCTDISLETRQLAAKDCGYLLELLAPVDPTTEPEVADITLLAAIRFLHSSVGDTTPATNILTVDGPRIIEAHDVHADDIDIRRAAVIANIPVEILPQATDELAANRVEDSWTTSDPTQLVNQLDWFALAERGISQREGELSPRVGLIKDAANILAARQIQRQELHDLDGGIPLQRATPERVDARTIRLGLAYAILERLSSDEPDPTIDRILRFTKQLQMNAQDAMLHRGGTRGIDGIRESPWSSRQPLAAEAEALLFALEAMHSR